MRPGCGWGAWERRGAPQPRAVRARILHRAGGGERGTHSPESPNTSTLTLSRAAILVYLATTPARTSLLAVRSSDSLAARARETALAFYWPNSHLGGDHLRLWEDAIGSRGGSGVSLTQAARSADASGGAAGSTARRGRESWQRRQVSAGPGRPRAGPAAVRAGSRARSRARVVGAPPG